MPQVIADISVCLDDFVAGADIMGEYFTRTGAAVTGRRMFDHGEKAWGDEPPFRVPVFVVTHRPPPWPPVCRTNCAFTLCRCCSVAAARCSQSPWVPRSRWRRRAWSCRPA
ncbi:hypothetical protein ACWZEH_35460 (plasmid) [Streptomyces sp. QTS137]